MCYRPLLLLSIVISAVCCWAQSDAFDGSLAAMPFRSNLTGYVHDSNDHPINGARVEVIDPNTGQIIANTFSVANGFFEVNNLRRGSYEVVAISGVSEQRTHLDVIGDRDVMFRLSGTTNRPPSGNASVSLSQLKIPGKARHLLEKAEDAFRRARLEDAFEFVQKALGVCPDYAKALTLRGILNMQKGDNKGAQPDLEKAVELDYGDDLSFIALASLYNNQGEYDRAQQALEHGMSLNPRSWQAGMEMARAQIGKKEFGAAIRSLDRAQPMAPPSLNIMHLFRAQALIGLKDYTSAGGELEAYLEKEPEGPNSNQARTTLAQLKEVTESARK